MHQESERNRPKSGLSEVQTGEYVFWLCTKEEQFVEIARGKVIWTMSGRLLLGGWQKPALVLMVLLGGFVGLGCAGGVQGSGDVTSETRNVSDFTEVALNGAGNLTIRQTGSESLSIEAEDNILPRLKTEVRSNRLTIEPDTNIQPTRPINYELIVKDLSALELEGAGSVDASDINTDSLQVTTEGAGNIKMAGEANSQNVDISGAGSYRAEDLRSKNAKIDISGAGGAVVNVSDALDVDISGLGSVEYIGNPTVSRNITGLGKVTRR